ncbi:MAG: hypothetical protein P4L43_05145 [Syntrophobacteraceae bacterium]|nr:hypothetical protein [Syntrophobacteraceae bacterium]
MKCPGQDTRYWGPEAVSEISCPKCGGPIEFFKDESSRKCRKCGEKVLNPKMDFGCALYCKFASQCLGTDMPPELLAKRGEMLKDRAATGVKKYLGKNFKRIGRMVKVIQYCEKIQKTEGGDPAIVTLAACLSAIAGISEGSEACEARFSAEDDAIARSILLAAGAPDEVTRRVMSILSNRGQSYRGEDLANYRCVSDALRIAEAIEEKDGRTAGTSEADATPLLTETGRKLIEQVSK